MAPSWWLKTSQDKKRERAIGILRTMLEENRDSQCTFHGALDSSRHVAVLRAIEALKAQKGE